MTELRLASILSIRALINQEPQTAFREPIVIADEYLFDVLRIRGFMFLDLSYLDIALVFIHHL
jgi:hypothetical protein